MVNDFPFCDYERTQQHSHQPPVVRVYQGHFPEPDTHVNTTDGSNHLGDDDHVSQVSLDGSGLFVGSGLLLGLSELLDQSKGLPLETSLEPSPRSGVDELGRVNDDDDGQPMGLPSSVPGTTEDSRR